MSRPAQPLEPRIWAKIDRGAENACWPWLGSRSGSGLGYGQVWVNGKNQRVTRQLWAMQFGKIPAGYLVLHNCDNSICCNPAHLRLGTHQDNMDDMASKGRRVTFAGKSHTLETRAKMSASKKITHAGSKNPQFGTKWLCKDGKPIKVKANDVQEYLDDGWTRGRK